MPPNNDLTKANTTYTLVITYFRSGSSFLGDLLQQNWRSFYTFEPLHYMTSGMKIDPTRETEAISLIKNIYGCKFEYLADYIRWVQVADNRFLFRWNKFLWSLCNYRKSLCYDHHFLSELCSRATNHVIKSTRLHVHNIYSLLANLDPNIKLNTVFLVRDPRAILAVRDCIYVQINVLMQEHYAMRWLKISEILSY